MSNDDLSSDIGFTTRRLHERGSEAAKASVPFASGQKGKLDPGKMATTTSVLDAHLGRLRGHSLIFVTHGLEGHGGDPDANGILFRNDNAKGDTILTVAHLKHMGIKDDHVVSTLSPGDVMDDLDDFVAFVDALRENVFERVYLCACGPNARLERFARLLAQLADIDVFYNEHRVWVSDQAKPYATVDDDNASNGEFVTGRRYFSKDVVELKTKTDTFFEGAETLALRPRR